MVKYNQREWISLSWTTKYASKLLNEEVCFWALIFSVAVQQRHWRKLLHCKFKSACIQKWPYIFPLLPSAPCCIHNCELGISLAWSSIGMNKTILPIACTKEIQCVKWFSIYMLKWKCCSNSSKTISTVCCHVACHWCSVPLLLLVSYTC
jgi:hypothetical protein